MLYNDFQNKRISALGLGTMRLPTINGQDSQIDLEATKEMVAYAMQNGINYYDTAWGYHGGNSEATIGEALKAYPRESFYLATKFPGYDKNCIPKVQEIFEKQLERCGVDYFDFYLFHNMCESNIDAYLDPQYGILEYLLEQKKNGRIRHLGFSTHGSLATMERFLNAYGEHMEFCQIQLNWLDRTFQQGDAKVSMLAARNIPIIVMEPVRGGKLAALPEASAAKLKELRPDHSCAAWAFRYLQSIPNVITTLSGMSNMEQLKENIETYRNELPLSEKETTVLYRIAEELTAETKLPCTKCKYCISHCPQALDIPWLLEIYNEYMYAKNRFGASLRLNNEESKRPAACIGCQSCEAVCPQNIQIAKAMKELSKTLG